jgi:hypothetical protein
MSLGAPDPTEITSNGEELQGCSILDRAETLHEEELRECILDRAEIVSQEIEYTLASFDPSFTTDILPNQSLATIDDCQFEDCIEDPLEIIRHVKGEETAQRLEYEGDLEFILQEIQTCRAILLNDNDNHRCGETTGTAGQAAKEGNVQGDPTGEKSHNCQGVA